jgi:uncharacterized iron-regulated membrane protein
MRVEIALGWYSWIDRLKNRPRKRTAHHRTARTLGSRVLTIALLVLPFPFKFSHLLHSKLLEGPPFLFQYKQLVIARFSHLLHSKLLEGPPFLFQYKQLVIARLCHLFQSD